MTTSFPIDGIALDRDGPANLHRQLYRQLRNLIERRVLPSGYALPSTRVMAQGSAGRPQHGDRRLRPAGAGRLSGHAAAHAAAW